MAHRLTDYLLSKYCERYFISRSRIDMLFYLFLLDKIYFLLLQLLKKIKQFLRFNY